MKPLFVALSLLSASMSFGQSYQPTWESIDSRPVPAWYRNGKFGIFIHWGVYSVPAFTTKGNYAEWYQHAWMSSDSATRRYHREKFGDRSYYDLARDFKAELFEPDEWARLIEASGARYIVLTSKHHDGFCLWPSQDADRDWGFSWNAMDAGPHRDLLGDLFKAIRKTSVHAGMYYSLYEWYNPLWLTDRQRYVNQHMWPQMKELVNTYRPDIFWTDGDWEASDTLWRSREFLAWLYNESPVKETVVTYDRWGSGVRFHHGEVYTPEYQPELSFDDHYWEENRGMGFSYGYNREEDAWDYNSAQSLVLQLIDKVSRGGNFLLDIGPDEHGKIPPIMQERLIQIGNWMHINQEAIYNTVAWRTSFQWGPGRTGYKPKSTSGDLLLKLTVDPDPGYAVKECFFTYNPEAHDLYVILPAYPSSGKFIVHDLKISPDSRIELLETHVALNWQSQKDGLSIELPPFDPSRIKSQYAFVIKIYPVAGTSAPAKVTVTYPEGSLNPLVTLSTAKGQAIHYTLDGTTADEEAPLYTGPFNVTTSCLLKARSIADGLQPGQVLTVPLHTYTWKQPVVPGAVSPGLALSQFLLSAPISVTQLEKVTASATGVASFPNLKDTLRTENCGLMYEGFLKVPSNGLYRFYLSSDDGSALWVDGEQLIDNDGLHGNEEVTGEVALQKGYHSFRLAYFQATGSATLALAYSMGKALKKDVPPSWFYRKK